MEGYHEYAGGQFDVQVTRVDDKVILSVYRDGDLLVQLTMNHQKLMGVLA